MAGLPFDYRAVDGEEALAIHYESGRYWAAHYRALGKRVTWKNQRHIPPTLKADLLRAMMP